jgi:sporulation protein YlmC with PRC-barrel domain
MARYGTLGDYRFSDTQEAALDIRGAKIYGSDDDKLGEIDDVIFDEGTGAVMYVVVDTGGWLSTKRFIVPPEEIRPSLQHGEDFRVDLTKEQIEAFPAYDGTALTSEEQWADYEKRYRSKWADGPIMHREATDRNITPTTQQQVHAGSGAVDNAGAETATSFTPVHSEGTMNVSPSGPTLRFSAFEDTLRQRRQDVLQSSIDNLKRASGEAFVNGERVERRKAS